ncbi:hypothetical protein I3843_04G159400 [Carya illinoinensis]|nr:hypothetical protein I3843_04G159400 [Carya illinoinensis]
MSFLFSSYYSCFHALKTGVGEPEELLSGNRTESDIRMWIHEAEAQPGACLPGCASSGDDLEDDACSRPRPLSPASPRSRTWIEILENFLWLASATFTIYRGDRHSNLIYLLWHDNRIRSLNALIFFYSSMSVWSVRRFSFALWPIWSFLTLLSFLHFTLFMACMVIFPYILIGAFRPQYDIFRID